MFCVECGADGPVYEGLCANCFRKRYPVVKPVEFLDLARCESCGSFRLRSGWYKVDRELVLPQLVRDAMPRLPPYERTGVTQVARVGEAKTLVVAVSVGGRL